MIITCDAKHLFARASERGYLLQDVLPCVIDYSGPMWTIDTDHPAYPKQKATQADRIARATERVQQQVTKAKKLAERQAPVVTYVPAVGPGTELKKMLSKIGIKASPTCSCNKRAQIMDEKGIEWCKANTTTIVGWLREEATKRGLPFIDLAGKIIVKRAISLAETAEKKRKQAEAANPAPNG
jgi:hypothetical protein